MTSVIAVARGADIVLLIGQDDDEFGQASAGSRRAGMGTDLLPFDEVTALIATASAIGILLLAPLYLSQRRDVQRLRAWMQENPEHPVSDLALSESRLDKTEVELEKLYAERGELVPGTAEERGNRGQTRHHPARALPAATRVTSERPALERITMERAALGASTSSSGASAAGSCSRVAGRGDRGGCVRHRGDSRHRRAAGPPRGRPSGPVATVDPGSRSRSSTPHRRAVSPGGSRGRSRTPASCPEGWPVWSARRTRPSSCTSGAGAAPRTAWRARSMQRRPEDRPPGPGGAGPTADGGGSRPGSRRGVSPSGREGRPGPVLLVALLVAALAAGVLVYHARTPDLALEVPEETFDRLLGTRGGRAPGGDRVLRPL